jgi:hypothetical protein
MFPWGVELVLNEFALGMPGLTAESLPWLRRLHTHGTPGALSRASQARISSEIDQADLMKSHIEAPAAMASPSVVS